MPLQDLQYLLALPVSLIVQRRDDQFDLRHNSFGVHDIPDAFDNLPYPDHRQIVHRHRHEDLGRDGHGEAAEVAPRRRAVHQHVIERLSTNRSISLDVSPPGRLDPAVYIAQTPVTGEKKEVLPHLVHRPGCIFRSGNQIKQAYVVGHIEPYRERSLWIEVDHQHSPTLKHQAGRQISHCRSLSGASLLIYHSDTSHHTLSSSPNSPVAHLIYSSRPSTTGRTRSSGMS